MTCTNTSLQTLDYLWPAERLNGDTSRQQRQIRFVSWINSHFFTPPHGGGGGPVGRIERGVRADRGVGMYPFPDADPFILRQRPDVYFIGNQPEFETALVGGERGSVRSLHVSTDKV
jgi:hypothetical protein